MNPRSQHSRTHLLRTFLLLTTVLAVLPRAYSVLAAQGMRTVDSVSVGVAADEVDHHYAGSETTSGESGGRRWRSATGWLSYSLRIYDDSPLTIICVVAGSEGMPEAFDVLVDGRKAATFTRAAGEAKAAELQVTLEPGATQGRTSVVVRLAAHPGARTARLVELKTVQEHLEIGCRTPERMDS